MTLRVGLVGTGYWARAVHGAAAVSHPDVDLAAVWGRDPGRTQETAAALGSVPAASVDDLISSVEAVVFAVPAEIQAQLAVKAARAGRHLLLEKPIAFSIGAGQAIEQAVAASGVSCLVFFTHLWIEETASWISGLRAEGGWDRGHVEMISAVLSSNGPFSTSPWRHERGGLWDLGPHALALLTTVMGPVESVVAARGPRDLTHLILRHHEGGSSTAALMLNARSPAPYRYHFDGYRIEAPPPTNPPEIGQCVAAAHAALSELAARTSGHPDHTQFADLSLGVQVLRILTAASASLAAGSSAVRTA